MALISLLQLTDRLGRTLDATQETQAEAFIDDASALVLQIANLDTDWTDADVPAAVIPVVVNMVRRAVENPRGLTSEQIGNYQWQASSGSSASSAIYATTQERRIIRRAAGHLSVGTVALEGYLQGGYGPSAFEEEFEF